MKKVIGFILFIIGFVFGYNNVLAFTEPETINYNETLETFNNPERGFYEPVGLRLNPTNNKALNYSSNLVHLRVDLSAFSGKRNGNKDLELTDDALNALSKSLKYIKSKGGSVIIRFAYDNYDGKANVEPSLNMILRHIEQLKPVFYDNRDVITYVELGFFGPWGEMHSSTISSTANVSLAIDKMLETVPKELSIGVRTPNYYAAWAGVERSKLDTFKSIKGTKYYRVGLFNDGYLGSESDLGTFSNRSKEISWLKNQAKHTLYGGEVVANFGATPINTVEYMSKEAFLTHTTYLNLRWNYDTIDNWRKEIYKGKDSLYVGQTGFKYIDNHLGYRFVLKNSVLDKEITNKSNLNINFSIENVGFANLVNNKKVTIVLENENNTYEIATDIDPTLWDSNSTVNIKKSIKLPNNIALGNYRVYLRISYYGNLTKDNNYKTIRLANANIWNSKIGANYIGKVKIKEYVPPKQEEPLPSQKLDEDIEDIIEEPVYEPESEEDSFIYIEEQEIINETTDDFIYTEEEIKEETKEEIKEEIKEDVDEEIINEDSEINDSKTSTLKEKDKTETKKYNIILLCTIIGLIIFIIIFYEF